MTTDAEHVPTFPKVEAVVRADGSGEVTVQGTSYPIQAASVGLARHAVTACIVDNAARTMNRAVRVRSVDVDGSVWTLIVHPDGRVESAGDEPRTAPAAAVPPAPDPVPSGFWPASRAPGARAPTSPQQPAIPPPHTPTHAAAPAAAAPAAPAAIPSPAPVSAVAPAPTAERSTSAWIETAEQLRAESTTQSSGPARRKSFIVGESTVQPARQGWRGTLARAGLPVKPSANELAYRDDVALVSQHWPGPRTIAIANPKGSANKTPTAVCLSAVFGRYGGAGVLCWDNNEARGTAAWRTRTGSHQATVLDLLPDSSDLLGAGAQAAQLAHYVHHQPSDKFDVLWSDQSVGRHEMTGHEVDAVHQVGSKYYRLIFMDSGNNERAANWLAMIDRADQLVIPCTNVEDTAEAGARMLEALIQRDEHSAELARNAVVIASKRTPRRDANLDRIVRDFAPLVRKVATIPHDPGLYSGIINFDTLNARTQRSWLAAGAAVARGL